MNPPPPLPLPAKPTPPPSPPREPFPPRRPPETPVNDTEEGVSKSSSSINRLPVELRPSEVIGVCIVAEVGLTVVLEGWVVAVEVVVVVVVAEEGWPPMFPVVTLDPGVPVGEV